jgi:hypothetical protein
MKKAKNSEFGEVRKCGSAKCEEGSAKCEEEGSAEVRSAESEFDVRSLKFEV